MINWASLWCVMCSPLWPFRPLCISFECINHHIACEECHQTVVQDSCLCPVASRFDGHPLCLTNLHISRRYRTEISSVSGPTPRGWRRWSSARLALHSTSLASSSIPLASLWISLKPATTTDAVPTVAEDNDLLPWLYVLVVDVNDTSQLSKKSPPEVDKADWA